MCLTNRETMGSMSPIWQDTVVVVVVGVVMLVVRVQITSQPESGGNEDEDQRAALRLELRWGCRSIVSDCAAPDYWLLAVGSWLLLSLLFLNAGAH